MTTVIINSHKVHDFAQWKNVFDKGENTRKEIGINILGCYQNVNDPNMVTVISEVPTVEMANTILHNMKNVMEESGVDLASIDSKIVTKIN